MASNKRQPEDEVLEGELVEMLPPPGNTRGGNPGFGRGERRHADAVACYQMSLAGYSYYEVGQHFGISDKRARRLIEWYLDKQVSLTAERVRKKETARLEALYKALAPGLEVGYVPAVMAAARISELIIKTNGAAVAQAPTESTEDAIGGELRDMISAARAKLALNTPTPTPAPDTVKSKGKARKDGLLP